MTDCCDDATEYFVGNVYKFTVPFTDPNGNPIDPTQVFAWAIRPDASKVALAPARVVLGTWTAPVSFTVAGPWRLYMSDANDDPTTANVTVRFPDRGFLNVRAL